MLGSTPFFPIHEPYQPSSGQTRIEGLGDGVTDELGEADGDDVDDGVGAAEGAVKSLAKAHTN